MTSVTPTGTKQGDAAHARLEALMADVLRELASHEVGHVPAGRGGVLERAHHDRAVRGLREAHEEDPRAARTKSCL